MAKKQITLLALDCIPRISRAQAFDVLSSMANIAGYKAVVDAAALFGRFFAGSVLHLIHCPSRSAIWCCVRIVAYVGLEVPTAIQIGCSCKTEKSRDLNWLESKVHRGELGA
ncbi:unnamed protein product [Dibothriocephalus latus]|uniref:proton-translocating NAD(P)(+) transhydrogenase n=1 Tax=Dibothriocephalus latus TaxID=60516 RepID=A0A3P7M0C6_DIBLA|nr:unnamed protein product [Dibothriocephalus latus]